MNYLRPSLYLSSVVYQFRQDKVTLSATSQQVEQSYIR
jgi:hypothetical protein